MSSALDQLAESFLLNTTPGKIDGPSTPFTLPKPPNLDENNRKQKAIDKALSDDGSSFGKDLNALGKGVRSYVDSDLPGISPAATEKIEETKTNNSRPTLGK